MVAEPWPATHLQGTSCDLATRESASSSPEMSVTSIPASRIAAIWSESSVENVKEVVTTRATREFNHNSPCSTYQ